MSNDLSINELADAIAERWTKNPPVAPPWVDQDAAGAFIGKHGRYMELLRRTGRGPRYVVVSKKNIRYSLSDLREWMHARYEGGES